MRVLAGSTVVLALGMSGQAAAIDCSRASTPVELAICGDPQVKAADDRMSEAYAAARAAASAEGQAALKASQRDWLLIRDDVCGQEQPVDTSCLLQFTEDRARLLAAEPVHAGPGAPDFVSTFLFRPQAARTFLVDIVYPRLAAGNDPRFAPLDQLLEDFALKDREMWEAPADPDLPEDIYLLYELGFQITYSSAEFVSVRFNVYSYSGGAHGFEYAGTVNFAPALGRALEVGDMLDAAAFGTAAQLCAKQIRQAKRQYGVDEASIAEWVTDDAVASVMQDRGAWTFWSDGATIYFAAYSVGPYAEGPIECFIPNERLATLVMPGAPLPLR